MTNGERRPTDRWLWTLRRAGLPGLATAGLLLLGADQLSAEHGWKFGKKSASEPAAAPKPPSNGFVTAIHKLQEEAKRRAFDGDVDGAIACAQRARKIAEASSMLVSEDPECTVEAADRLVEKLMAVKATARVPTKSPVQPGYVAAARQQSSLPPIAPVSPHPVFAQRPATAAPRTAPLPPPIPSWERPVTAFAPHPVAATVQPVAVVAGGWVPETSHAEVAAAESPIESIEEIVQSDERTFALLMARAKLPQKFPQLGTAANTNDWAGSGPESVAGSSRYSAEDGDWQSDSPEVTPAVQVEAEVPSAAGQFELLHQIQSAEPAAPQVSALSAEESPYQHPIEAQRSPQYSEFAVEFDTAVASANQSSGTRLQDETGASVQQATLSQDTTADDATNDVTPTGYATTPATADHAKPQSDASTDSALDEALRVPTVYFRDVEPLSTRAATPPASSIKTPPFHLAERLAKWMKLPVTTVAAGMGGLGLILLGIGLFMARTALRPHAAVVRTGDETASA